MNILVVGCGGLGGYIGAILAKAGLNVSFLVRPLTAQLLKQQGLKVESAAGDFQLEQLQVDSDPRRLAKPDVVLLTVKTYSTEDACKTLESVLPKGCILITVQNGVENVDRAMRWLPQARVYAGNALIVSRRSAPGVINQTAGPRRLLFGDVPYTSDPDLTQIEHLFQSAGLDTTYSTDIERDIWEKFCLITAFGGLTALCRTTIGTILTNQAGRSLYETCVRETIAVGRAKNVNLPEKIFDSVMARSQAYLNSERQSASKSSMAVDIEAGHETEIETLNGTVVRLSNQFGLDAPVNTAIYAGVKLASGSGYSCSSS